MNFKQKIWQVLCQHSFTQYKQFVHVVILHTPAMYLIKKQKGEGTGWGSQCKVCLQDTKMCISLLYISVL